RMEPCARPYRTVAGADGRFRFVEVASYPEGHLYVLAATWAGIEQTSLPRLRQEITQPTEFPLYEITDDLGQVVANRGNLRVEFQQIGGVPVLQMLLELAYVNLGDHIVLDEPNTPQAHAFTLELPVGAFNIAPEQPPGGVQRFQPVENLRNLEISGVQDTQPLAPGYGQRLAVSFFVPYRDGAVIDMRLPFALDDLGVFVQAAQGLELEGDFLNFSETQTTSTGRRYDVYTQTTPLEPNAPLKFSLAGQPINQASAGAQALTSTESDTALVLVLGGGVALLVIMGLAIWFWLARRTERQLL
ncbi:MAG: hypothetical protein HC915_20710, partial [Anaerolineae bacterium]|nr:hypothetical protein [Anaerolineae bacterium]